MWYAQGLLFRNKSQRDFRALSRCCLTAEDLASTTRELVVEWGIEVVECRRVGWHMEHHLVVRRTSRRRHRRNATRESVRACVCVRQDRPGCCAFTCRSRQSLPVVCELSSAVDSCWSSRRPPVEQRRVADTVVVVVVDRRPTAVGKWSGVGPRQFGLLSAC